ncbi:MAG: hypothetical protein RLZZ455_1044 [Candidatus Parcubacteria bacterium]|jgi:hypothetical protein
METFKSKGTIHLSESAIRKLPSILFDLHQDHTQSDATSNRRWDIHDLTRFHYGKTFPIGPLLSIFEANQIPHEHHVLQEGSSVTLEPIHATIDLSEV